MGRISTKKATPSATNKAKAKAPLKAKKSSAVEQMKKKIEIVV